MGFISFLSPALQKADNGFCHASVWPYLYDDLNTHIDEDGYARSIIGGQLVSALYNFPSKYDA